MQMILSIIFILSYVVLIVALIKGANPTLVLLGTAILWALLGGAGLMGILNDLIGAQITNSAATFMTILFGSWFAQVMVKTGIVSTIIRTAVELGGENPKAVVIIVMLVVSLLFTSLFSIGPVIAVGVIVLPVMISMGVKPHIATVAYVISVGVGTLVNVSQYSLLRGIATFGEDIPEQMSSPWTPYAFIAFGIGVVVNITGVLITMHFSNSRKKIKSWAAKAGYVSENEIKFAPAYACLAPFVPVLLVIIFKINIFVAFILGAIYAIAATKTKYKGIRIFPMISKTIATGFSEASGMVIYVMATTILSSSAKIAAPIIEQTVGHLLPTTTLGLSIMCAIGIPLLMYRGPLATFGAGAAIYATIAAVGAIPNQFLWMIAFTMAGIHYALDPTGSLNVWATSYTKVKPAQFIKTVLPINWVFGICIIILLYIIHG